MERKTRRNGMRGQVATAMLFIVVFLFLLTFFILTSPLVANISTYMTASAVEVLKENNSVIQQIQDENIRANLTQANDDAITSLETNVNIGLALAKYGWIGILLLVVMVMYLRSRIIVEREKRGLI